MQSLTRRKLLVGAAVAIAGPLATANAARRKPMPDLKFEIYKVRKTGRFHWRLKAVNNRTIAVSDESHARKESCKEALELIRASAASATTEDLT